MTYKFIEFKYYIAGILLLHLSVFLLDGSRDPLTGG